ncbi:MAG: DUF4833 domain-containing protein [Polyangiales bacterium]
MRAPRLAALLVGIGLAWPVLVSAFDGNDVATVFFIRKSENVNRVDYGIVLDAHCRPEGDEPVVAYWRRLTRGPNVTEALGFPARRAYGISSQSVRRDAEGGHVSLRLRALSSRRIVVSVRPMNGGCRAWATTTIAGEAAQIVDIYVVLSGRISVDHIELTGRTPDGRRVVEQLRP